jgi:peptidoglycan/xylan/chitin deacetylase (PgdA/CDA1 family)
MEIPVIAYHKIDVPTEDVRVRGAYTSPKRFAKQISYLKKQGFNFYSASALIEYYLEHNKFPKQAITLTFDDGWKDNYTNAFPILREHGIKATIFLVPSCIGQVSSKVVAEGESAREHLSGDDIIEMSRHGIEFGSHSVNHQLLHQLAPQEVEYEVLESKRQIENLIQQPCKVFAYPAGFFTETAQSVVRKAGYIAAFSSVYGPVEKLDIYALNRTEILRRDRFPFQFARKIKRMVELVPA